MGRHLALMRETRISYKIFWSGNLRPDHYKNLGVDGRTIVTE
jgi:hypothetical protein